MDTEKAQTYTEEILWHRLSMLLSQNQFELFFPAEVGVIGLIYLMNDAVESAFYFHDAVLTGNYRPDYEGPLDAELYHQDNRYTLIVHQGDNVFTLFFQKLTFQADLYNYGSIGHFWMDGDEYLRQLEYKISILHDKYQYLGDEFCTPAERKLAVLQEFPPLNDHCYPAVPAQYRPEPDPDWYVSQRALTLMTELSNAVDDRSMVKALKLYRHFPNRVLAKYIANLLRTTRHSAVVDLLAKTLKDAASCYPTRVFPEEQQQRFQTIYHRAVTRQQILAEQGVESVLLVQEPFLLYPDEIEYEVTLMIWQSHGRRRTVTLERFQESDETSL